MLWVHVPYKSPPFHPNTRHTTCCRKIYLDHKRLGIFVPPIQEHWGTAAHLGNDLFMAGMWMQREIKELIESKVNNEHRENSNEQDVDLWFIQAQSCRGIKNWEECTWQQPCFMHLFSISLFTPNLQEHCSPPSQIIPHPFPRWVGQTFTGTQIR